MRDDLGCKRMSGTTVELSFSRSSECLDRLASSSAVTD